MFIAMLALGAMTFSFKLVYDNLRHTIFEDIYGRGVVFFFFSVLNYLKTADESVSIFDIKPHIRMIFMGRVIFISLAYIFLYLAIMDTSSFIYVALMLCMLYPVFKFMSRYSLVDVGFTIFDTIAFGIALVGMYFLYNGNDYLSKSRALDYDNQRAYIYGVISIFCWSVANFMLHRQKVYVHNKIDSFFVSLFTILILPGLILCYFSNTPQKLEYSWI